MKNRILHAYTAYRQLVQDLCAELEAYTDEQLNRRPPDGGWSAIQTMHHLIAAEGMSLEYVIKKMGYEPNPTKKVGLSEHWRSFLLNASLALPIKVKAPAIVESRQNLPDFATLADTKTRWLGVLENWTAFFDQMPESHADKVVYKQPRAGKIGWLHTISFFKAHFLRHRGQVRRALR